MTICSRRGLISDDDFSLFKMCNSVDEAVAEIAQFFYRTTTATGGSGKRW